MSEELAPYREDREMLLARIAELEAELAKATAPQSSPRWRIVYEVSNRWEAEHWVIQRRFWFGWWPIATCYSLEAAHRRCADLMRQGTVWDNVNGER